MKKGGVHKHLCFISLNGMILLVVSHWTILFKTLDHEVAGIGCL